VYFHFRCHISYIYDIFIKSYFLRIIDVDLNVCGECERKQ
jgi:hypothetical protein